MNTETIKKDAATQRDSFTKLLGDLANKSADVVHDEIELLIQKISEKATAVRNGILTLAIGTAISFAAFLSFCAALIIELTSYMVPAMAVLVTGAALASIGVVIAFIGYKLTKKSILKK